MVKFIHTADLHLNSPFKGLTQLSPDLLNLVKSSTFTAFEAVVNKAIEENVDFLLVAGDLFDLSSRSIKAQVFLKDQFNLLKDHQIAVFIAYGNHDYVLDNRFYLEFPNNVHVFGEEVESKLFQSQQGARVALTGFSYHERHVRQNIMANFPQRDPEVDYHIGVYHGDLQSQSLNYAPFTLDDLKRLHYHYMALGHIHKGGQLLSHPPAYYSGNTQGRHMNEQGAKGALLVELKGRDHEVNFFPTSSIDWQVCEIEVFAKDTINTLVERIYDLLDSRSQQKLIKIKFKTKDPLAIDLADHLTADHLNQILKDQGIWVVTVDWQEYGNTLDLANLYPHAWRQSVEAVDGQQFAAYLSDLTKQIDNHYLTDFKQANKRNELIDRAVQLIQQADKSLYK